LSTTALAHRELAGEEASLVRSVLFPAVSCASFID